jgi:hypothetical protein
MRATVRRSYATLALFAGLLLFSLSGAAGAPVPKHLQKAEEKPTKLSAKWVAGTWGYEWSGMLGGWITFREDGTYTAQHRPETTQFYEGTFFADESGVTITEWGFDPVAGTRSGPTNYRFDFDLTQWPAPAGKSTGGFGFDAAPPAATLHVKLRDRKAGERGDK